MRHGKSCRHISMMRWRATASDGSWLPCHEIGAIYAVHFSAPLDGRYRSLEGPASALCEGFRVSALGVRGVRGLQGELLDVDGTPYQERGYM